VRDDAMVARRLGAMFAQLITLAAVTPRRHAAMRSPFSLLPVVIMPDILLFHLPPFHRRCQLYAAAAAAYAACRPRAAEIAAAVMQAARAIFHAAVFDG